MVVCAILLAAETAWADGGIAVPGTAQAETEKECGACHRPLLPITHKMIEWRQIMANLSDHMGEDASLPENVRADIEAYLVANASDAVSIRRSE